MPASTITVGDIINRLANLKPHPWTRDASVSSNIYHVLKGPVPPYRVTISGGLNDPVSPQTAASVYHQVGII